ncbi:cuticle protein-like, partial [Nymphalis io]|uniref:cuticle protein-like n=1 Tax=Inachis io TaxID=171585 RepID=UPI00216A0987
CGLSNFLQITCFLALSAFTNADGLGGLVYAPGHSSLEYYSYPSYAFEYAVKDPHTGDNKAQWEKRDGDVVRGAYSLVEPDGSLRVVEYRADDKTGFNAVVKRIGPNLHPVAAPIYKAPLPVLGYKADIPISIGPVAGIEKLANAPLLNGPYLGGGAYSSAILYKTPSPAVIKEVAPIAPIIPAPILPAPIIKNPIYSAPLYDQSLLQAPILKKAPLLQYPLPEPIYPIYPSLKAPLPALKSWGPLPNAGLYDLGLLGKGLLNDKLLLDYSGAGGLDYKGYAGIGLGYKGGYGH